jgi:type IV secretion system protein VirB10
MPDQDNSFASRAVPEVQNRALKAPGIMPKNAQTWAIVGISAVMITVIAFSSSGTPKVKPRSVTAEQQSTSLPNQRQIDQYKAMVDEEARKLAFERQRLEKAKADAQNAAATAQFGAPLGPPVTTGYAATQAVPTHEQSPEEAQKLALEAERKKREYFSLFSSNVSLSFRKDQNNQAFARPTDQAAALPALQATSAELNAPRSELTGYPTPGLTVPPSPTRTTTIEQPDRGLPNSDDASTTPSNAERKKGEANDPALQKADGNKYRLFEGTVLETVLTNRLSGSFSGPINVMLTTNVYSHDHQQLLIPQGTRVLGEVQKVNSFGQQRLAVFFHRLIMPDGYSVSLDQFHGLNQIGETGLRDQVNHHYLQVFGVSLAIGAIAGIEQAGSNYGYSMGGVDAYRRGVSESLSQSALRILDRYLNTLPTFTVREGHRVKVFISDDLMLPAYDRHRLPADV